MPGQDPAVREIHTVKMSFIGKEANPVLVRQLDDYNLVYEEYRDENEPETRGNEAVEFLHSILANGGVDSNEIKKLAEEAGIASATLNRAKKRAGAVSRRLGDRSCIWEQPGAIS